LKKRTKKLLSFGARQSSYYAMTVARRAFLACACCAVAPLRAVAATAADPNLPTALELGTPGMTRIAPAVWVAPLAPGLWLHTTTANIGDGVIYPSNGLILDHDAGTTLIDTGTHPDHAETLLTWSARRGHPITLAIATHFHNDRTGGIPALSAAGIRTVAHPLTAQLAASHGTPVPSPLPGFTGASYRLDAAVELAAMGAGHTRDNIAVWLPRHRALHGGCFLKSATVDDLGYVADSDIAAWPASLRQLSAAYPERGIVVPGHGSIAGDPVRATARLLAKT
jgi:glyoxylase-like metal-dependent hydrolase (beta-lactamase superfamily II)